MEDSKNKINHSLIVLTILLILTSSLVTAYKEEFTATSNSEEVTLCACDLAIDKIFLNNNGDVTSTFILEPTGTAAKWVNLAPMTFYLEQGQSKQVDRFIKVPCRARGQYTLDTTIRTIFDTEQELKQTLNVENCPNVQITAKSSTRKEVCPCTPVQYDFTVTNTGNHVETYELSVEPYSEAITLSTDIMILEPGQKEAVSVFLNLECGKYGDDAFTLNVLAHGTGILGQSNFELNVLKCYDYELNTEEQYAVCQGIPNIIPAQIINNATMANAYSLTTVGPDWIYPENDSITMPALSISQTNILAFPPVEEESAYSVILNSLSVRGEEMRTREIVLETEKCFDYELIETQDVFKAAECKPKEHTLKLKNTGSRQANYIVELEGLDWLTTSPAPLLIEPDDEKEVKIMGQTPCTSAGEYAENVYITITEVNQTYVEQKTVTILPKEDFYIPKIDLTDMNIDHNGGESQATITNAGYEAATYDLRVDASDWVTIDKTQTTLEPGQNETITITAVPTEETSEDTYLATIVAEIPAEGIEYSKDFFIEVKEEETGKFAMILAFAGILLLVAIIAAIILLTKRKKKKEKTVIKQDKTKAEKQAITVEKREYRRKSEESKRRFWPILLIILIALILGGAAYYAMSSGMFQKQETTQNETNQTAQEEVPLPKPEQTETGVLTNEDIQESLIVIDREGVPGTGNQIELDGQTEINLILSIKNPTDRKAVFTVKTQEESWVKFEKEKISIMPNRTELLNFKITPDLDALKKNDYAILINTTLEGKKIYYEESLNLVLTKKKMILEGYLPWLLGGIAVLILLLLIRAVVKRRKRTKEPKKAEQKTKTEKKQYKKDKGLRLWPILFFVLLVAIAGAAGIASYKFCKATTTGTEAVENETVQLSLEEKVTEENTQEALVVMDRTAIAGKDDKLEITEEKYDVPITIKNPTDKKARFAVNTNENTWITFERYNIIIEPNTQKTVNMTITPDLDALEDNDYQVTITTSIQGEKIDYTEEVQFVLTTKKKLKDRYLTYVIIGIVLLFVLIFFTKVFSKYSKNRQKKQKQIEKIEKNGTEANKMVSELRKKTVLKLKRKK